MDAFININILLWMLLTLIKNPSFNKNLNPLLDRLSKENKRVFLLGDFNINLLNYNDHQPADEFLDSLASNSFLPCFLQPTRLTSHSKTLIDNILSNVTSHEVISGNITATISDDLPQFLFFPNVLSNPSYQKSNIYEGDWSNFVQENLVLKETGLILFRKTLFWTILIKIGLMSSNSTNRQQFSNSTYFQTHLAKSQIFIKETNLSLFSKLCSWLFW